MRNSWNALVAEGGGTFLFLFVGIGSAAMVDWSAVIGQELPGLLVVALAHGLVLAVLVTSLGTVSGAHFNPAVTFGVWVAGQMSARSAIAYVAAQLVGGVAAAFMLRTVFPAAVSPGLGVPALGPGIESSGGLAIEAVLTVVLVLAVFGTVIDPRAPKVGGLAIGLALGAVMLMGGPLTGAAVNPARWFAPALMTGTWDNAPVWIIGPLVGAAIAARAYRLFFLPATAPERTPATPTG